MPLISPTLPSDGTNAVASSVDTPLNAILTLINGGLDDANIASVSGTKITAGTLPNSALSTTAQQGWNTLSSTLTWSADNGNRETVLGSTVDLTSVLSPGARFSIKRGTTPPTQCMSFASASSQYAYKTSPSGLTFTGNFTWETWVLLNSYPSGFAMLACELDAPPNNGTYLNINSSGQIGGGYIGGGGTNTTTYTNQSIPLGQWVHVAMSVTVASKTFAIYINGVAVSMQSTSGTSTTVSQTGVELGIGGWAATSSQYFDGYISEVRLWSTAQSQANIQANKNINLVGNETNLVGLWQGNGAWTDGTSNANTLTPSGGASDTQAANPYNATEYGVVTKVTSTQLTIFTPSGYVIPNETLNTPMYSLLEAPYGFPAGSEAWTLIMPILAVTGIQTGAAGSWAQFTGTDFAVPTGTWRISYKMITTGQTTTGSSGQSFAIQLSPLGVTPTSDVVWSETQRYQWMPAATGSGGYLVGHSEGDTKTTLTLLTTLRLWGVHTSAPGGSVNIYMERSPAFFRAECAYI